MKQPHMRDTLLGAVVRVALGRRAEDVVATYSMCLVHDIEDGKQYTCARVVPILIPERVAKLPVCSICTSPWQLARGALGMEHIWSSCPSLGIVIDGKGGAAVTQPLPCSFHGVSSTFETDKYLVIVDAADQRQHTISFALVSNADLRPEEFDRFHESRSSNGVGQITKREVRTCAHGSLQLATRKP